MGLVLNFHDKLCEAIDEKGTKLLEIEMNGHSFVLKLEGKAAYYVSMDETTLWHKRYRHCNFDTLKHMTDR